MLSRRRERPVNQRSPGCFACKARKKKCDLRAPVCLACERNVLLCRWPEQAARQHRALSPVKSTPRRLGASTNRHQNHLAYPLLATLMQEPCFGGNSIKHPISQMLYQHWVYQTANNMSALQGHANAFATELPKLAIRFPETVLQSLLALSGVHYCNKNRNPAVEELAWSHLAQALRALKYGLTRHVTGSEDDALPLLVTTLILCFLETTRGDTEGHLNHHLRAARPLLCSTLSNSCDKDSSTLDFIKEYYAYIAYITDLSVDTDSIESENSEESFNLSHLVSPKSPGVLLGCSYELYDLIPKVTRACRSQLYKSSSNHSSKVMDAQWVHSETCLELQSKILGWQPPVGSDESFITCGRIFQQSLLIYLEMSSVDHSVNNQAVINSRIDVIIAMLELLPQTAPISATLCWPLALVGSLTRNARYRKIIRLRLDDMWDLLALSNIKATRDFLDRLWGDEGSVEDCNTSSPYRPVSLEASMRRYGIKVSFV